MANYITGFSTSDGVKKYDYNALANKPEAGADFITNVARGEVITMTDATNRGLRSLNIYGKTTQNGTPTPEAPVALVSAGDSVTITAAGKNLISNNWQQGMLAVEDGTTLTINNYWVTNPDYIVVDSGKDYTFSADTANFACAFWYDEGKNFISYVQPLMNQTSKTLVLPAGAKYVRVTYNYSKATETITPDTMGVKHYIQLELGSVATEYDSYAGQSMTVATPTGLPGIPVTSGGNYADANGQRWVCDEIDFARGVYVQRVYRTKLTNADGIKRVESGFGYRFAYATPQLVRSDKTSGACSLCDSLPLGGYGETFSKPNCYTVNGIEIMIALTGSETIAELAAYLAEKPIEVQGVLATPVETPLSEEELDAYIALRTYRDHTTVYNDAGAYMELEYVMDAKKYIDGLVTSAILPATVE